MASVRNICGAAVGLAVAISILACTVDGHPVAAPNATVPTITPPPQPSQLPTTTTTPLNPPAPQAQPAVIYPCYDEPVVKPKALMLACGDGKLWLTDLTWEDWGMPTASATGQLRQNNCQPSCANGRDVLYPASVVVTGLTDGYYTNMRVLAPRDPNSPMYFTLDKEGPAAGR